MHALLGAFRVAPSEQTGREFLGQVSLNVGIAGAERGAYDHRMDSPFDDGREIRLPRNVDGRIDLAAIPPQDLELLLFRMRCSDEEISREVSSVVRPEGFTLPAQ